MIYLAELPGQAGPKELHQAAWGLLRLGLGEQAPGLVLENSLYYGDHGKPYLTGGPFFSISHTKGLVLCAIESQEVGVDAEYYGRRFSQRLRERAFTGRERLLAGQSPVPNEAFTALWTLKESYMKFTGKGLSLGPGSMGFSSLGEGPELESVAACFRHARWKGWHIAACMAQPFTLELHPVGISTVG